MTFKSAVLAFGITLAVSTAHAQLPAETDAQFVAKAIVGNMFEMEEAKLAEQRATDPNLKGFAKRMLADHGAALKKLKTAAGKAGISTPTALDQPHQAMLDNLGTFTGSDFDEIYKADQVSAHVETANLLQDYKQNGKNGELKSWAKDTLPVVQQHKASISSM